MSKKGLRGRPSLEPISEPAEWAEASAMGALKEEDEDEFAAIWGDFEAVKEDEEE